MNNHQRIDVQCLAILDQRRAYVRERHDDLFRIGLNGPGPLDSDFVRTVFLMVAAEMFMRHGDDAPTGGA